MGDACRALDFPIVSGNVSLYNESKATGGGSAILPTPAIGGVGLLADWSTSATIALKAAGEDILLIGGTTGHLGQSLYLREILGREAGAPPTVDLAAERQAGELIRRLILEGRVTAVHDVSDGGLLVAATEMALAGGIGAELDTLSAAQAFGEDQGRYLVTVSSGIEIEGAVRIGRTIDRSAVYGIPLADLRRAHEDFFPTLMGADAALA
jgi:phosphoribosylformylglycinamidine synthase